MKREDQVVMIMQLVKQQRRKDPNAVDMKILEKVRNICIPLVADNVLDPSVMDLSLAAAFEAEKKRYDTAIRKEAVEIYRQKSIEHEKKEKARMEVQRREKEEREREAARRAAMYDDPCGGGFRSCRSGGC